MEAAAVVIVIDSSSRRCSIKIAIICKWAGVDMLKTVTMATNSMSRCGGTREAPGSTSFSILSW